MGVDDWAARRGKKDLAEKNLVLWQEAHCPTTFHLWLGFRIHSIQNNTSASLL